MRHCIVLLLPQCRTTTLADEPTTEEMLDRLEKFHKNFLIEHSHADQTLR